jgi:hypothetical protein
MERTQVRRFAPIIGVALAVTLALSNAALAGIDPEVRAGIYSGAEQVSLGGGLLMPVGHDNRWDFNPNVEATISGRDFVAVSGDVHYDFRASENTALWVGGGPAILWTNRPGSDNNTDLGLNVLTGVGAKHGSMRPFAQLRGTVADENRIAIAGGIRF